MNDLVVNDIVPTPATQTDITEKSGSKHTRNPERQTTYPDEPEVPSKKKHSRDGQRRDRDRSERRGKKEKEQERLREPVDSFSESSTLDECKSDRDCAQGKCEKFFFQNKKKKKELHLLCLRKVISVLE